jgi:hypothetical protein
LISIRRTKIIKIEARLSVGNPTCYLTAFNGKRWERLGPVFRQIIDAAVIGVFVQNRDGPFLGAGTHDFGLRAIDIFCACLNTDLLDPGSGTPPR